MAAGVLAEARRQGLALTTLDEATHRHEPAPAPPDLGVTSWGEGGDLRTWSGPRVADLAFALRTAELRWPWQSRRPGSGPGVSCSPCSPQTGRSSLTVGRPATTPASARSAIARRSSGRWPGSVTRAGAAGARAGSGLRARGGGARSARGAWAGRATSGWARSDACPRHDNPAQRAATRRAVEEVSAGARRARLSPSESCAGSRACGSAWRGSRRSRRWRGRRW